MDITRCNTKSLCVFLVLVSIYSLKGGSGEVIRCIEKERQALLRFKQEVVDPHGALSSWGPEENKSECCRWNGVKCNSTTGHVIGLNFGDIFVSGRLYFGQETKAFHEECNSGLVIQNLDWLSNLSSLIRIHFTCSSFTRSLESIMFRNILMVSSLKEVYLRDCNFSKETSSVDVYANSTSASLSDLELSGVSLTSSAYNWLFNISASLVTLELFDNQLDGPIPDAFGQISVSLGYLGLSSNRFEGGIPRSLQNLTSLEVLDLSYNYLTEPLPEIIETMVSLEALDLSHNRITGSLPESVGGVSKLEYLDVSFNSLEGEISESHLSNLHSLKRLDLSYNSLALSMSPDWTPPFDLGFLNLASCDLGGPRALTWVHTQRNIYSLDFSQTNISGEFLGRFLDSHPRLSSLNLSHNHISGKLPDLSSKLFGCNNLDLSFNELSGLIPSVPPNLTLVNLSNNKFYGKISFLCNAKFDNIGGVLDLSNNRLSGELPNCLESKSVFLLNLSNNSFSGKIPYSLGSRLSFLFLRNNNLSGKLPSGLSNSRHMIILDVRDNNLTGNIPKWIGYLTWLVALDVRGNNFDGSIPPQLCYLQQLQVLDLSRNNLSGRIPLHCFKNFTNLIRRGSVLDFYYSNNLISYSNSKIVVQWKGKESEYSKALPLLQLIDLSSNTIEGNIPTEVFQMEGLTSLNLSRNHLTGNIDPAIDAMVSLEILDLSRNQLCGDIPEGLKTLSFLNTLDLSNNNLSGKIPSGTQLQSFKASVYAGNSGLCGPPLQSCPEDGFYTLSGHRGKLDNGDENDDTFMNGYFLKEFYITLGFGFIVGFWGTISTLILMKSWRYTYFHFFDSLCLKAAIYMRRLS